MIDNVILKMIEELKSTTKTNEKKVIIADYFNKFSDDGIGKFFDLVLNPRKLFYAKSLDKLPQTAAAQVVRPEVTTEYILEKLYQSKSRKEKMDTLVECLHYASTITKKIVNIILAKDMDCGVGIALVNSAIGFKMITDFEVAKAEEAKYIDSFENIGEFYWNLKVDGQRLIVLGNIHDDFLFLSSSGKEITQLQHTKMGDELKQLVRVYLKQSNKKSVCFDAELLGVDDNGKELERRQSNGICTKMQNMNANEAEVSLMRAWIFDVIGYDTVELEYKGTTKPQWERVEELLKLRDTVGLDMSKIIFLEYNVVSSIKQLLESFKDLVKHGYEGVIAKRKDAPYQIKRQQHWVKIKKEVEIDVVVTGWTPHKKRKDMIGSLLIESSCGRIKGKIGTGEWLTEENRLELHRRALNGTLEGIILEIGVMEISKNKKNDELSFYLPRITRERTDKNDADDYEKIMSMF